MALRYKVDVYDIDGDYVTTLSDVASFANVARQLNAGDADMDLPIALPATTASTALVLGNEFRISQIRDSEEETIYSGYVEGIERNIGGSADEVKVNLIGYAGRMARTMLIGPGTQINITRDGTFASDATSFGNGLDTNLASDQIKFVTNMYRYRNSDVSQQWSVLSGGTETGTLALGLLRRRAQSFTTFSGANDERNIITGVRLKMSYNTGTQFRMDVSIRNDSAGEPGGTTFAISRCPEEAIQRTASRYYDFPFDEPLSLAASTKFWIYVASTGAGSDSVYDWTNDSGGGFSGGERAVSTDGGSTWSVIAGQDHHFQLMYADEDKVRVNYTSTSISDSGDDKDWQYTALTDGQALNYVSKYGPSDWNWYLDKNNTMHFNPGGFAQATVIDTCDVTTGWVGTDATNIVTNINNRKEGLAAVSFDLAGTGSNPRMTKALGSTVDVSTYKRCGCWVFIPSDTNFTKMSVVLFSGGGADAAVFDFPRDGLVKGAWNWLTPLVDLSKPTSDTGVDFTAISNIRLSINTNASETTTGWLMDDWKAGNMNIHVVTKGKNLLNFKYRSHLDDLTNRFFFTNNRTTNTQIETYANQDSIGLYGTWDSMRVDSRIANNATLDSIGQAFVASVSEKRQNVSMEVSEDGDDIIFNELEPNDLIELRGFEDEFEVEKYYVILNVKLTPSVAQLEVQEIGTTLGSRVSLIDQRLDRLESSSATTGDTPKDSASITDALQ